LETELSLWLVLDYGTICHMTSSRVTQGGGRFSDQCFMFPPTQYRLYGRWFLHVKRPNQQYQSTEGDATKEKTTKYTYPQTIIYTHKDIHKTSTASPLVYTNMA